MKIDLKSLGAGFFLCMILVVMFIAQTKENIQNQASPTTVATNTTNSDDSLPVYKLIGRMDFAISNPASTAYVFERGGIYEYVMAKDVRPLSAEFKLTEYFVKVKDGTFYPLETEAK